MVPMVLLGVVGEEEEKAWPLGVAMVVMAAMVTETNKFFVFFFPPVGQGQDQRILINCYPLLLYY